MAVWGEIEKAIAMAEASRGHYLIFAADADEEKAKKVFKEMAEDMERHVMILESRRDFLQEQAKQEQNGGGANGGNGNEKQKKQN